MMNGPEISDTVQEALLSSRRDLGFAAIPFSCIIDTALTTEVFSADSRELQKELDGSEIQTFSTERLAEMISYTTSHLTKQGGVADSPLEVTEYIRPLLTLCYALRREHIQQSPNGSIVPDVCVIDCTVWRVHYYSVTENVTLH